MWAPNEFKIPEITVPKEVLLSVCARFFMKEFGWASQQAHASALMFFSLEKNLNFTPTYRGDWYVHGIRYPDGHHGLVSNNYRDGMWRIVKAPEDGVFATRESAARRELELAFRAWNEEASIELQKGCFEYI